MVVNGDILGAVEVLGAVEGEDEGDTFAIQKKWQILVIAWQCYGNAIKVCWE